MKINPHMGKAKSIILQKLAVFDDLSIKIHGLKQRQEELERALLAQAPKSLQEFLAEGWLSSTLNFGECTGKADLADCNCKSYDDAKKKFGELKKVWRYVIKVHFPSEKDFNNHGRLDLKFSVF